VREVFLFHFRSTPRLGRWLWPDVAHRIGGSVLFQRYTLPKPYQVLSRTRLRFLRAKLLTCRPLRRNSSNVRFHGEELLAVRPRLSCAAPRLKSGSPPMMTYKPEYRSRTLGDNPVLSQRNTEPHSKHTKHTTRAL